MLIKDTKKTNFGNKSFIVAIGLSVKNLIDNNKTIVDITEYFRRNDKLAGCLYRNHDGISPMDMVIIMPLIRAQIPSKIFHTGVFFSLLRPILIGILNPPLIS
jgi:L-arabinose isomerase